MAYLNHFALAYALILLALLALNFRRKREELRRVLRISVALALGYLPIALSYIQLKYAIDARQPYEIRAFPSDLLPSLFFDDPTYVIGGLVLLLSASCSS